MHLSISLLATKSELLMNGLLLMVVGMGVVFFALTVIMFMLLVMRVLPLLQEGRPSATPKPVSMASASQSINLPKPLPPLPPTDDGIAPEIVAVISAVVIAIAGANARVRSIRLVRPYSQSQWAGQGRSRQHQSHHVHRGKR